METTKKAKHIPTINQLHVEDTGKPNEYGEREIVIRAATYTETDGVSKNCQFTPQLATITFGYGEPERRANAEEIVKRCNNYDDLLSALQSMVNAANEESDMNFALNFAEKLLAKLNC